MARYCCSWCNTTTERRDFRQDHGGGPEELPHRPKRVKKTPKKKPGCAGNDGGSHVYVLVKFVIEKHYETYVQRPTVRYRKICAGCGRKNSIRWGITPDESEVYETRYLKDIWDFWS